MLTEGLGLNEKPLEVSESEVRVSLCLANGCPVTADIHFPAESWQVFEVPISYLHYTVWSLSVLGTSKCPIHRAVRLKIKMPKERMTSRTQPGQIPDLALADSHSFPVLRRKTSAISQPVCADLSGRGCMSPPACGL